MAKVVCLGILVADLVARPVDEYPERGALILVEDMELHTGGCAANTGLTLATLGLPTAVIGKVGKDGLGDFLVNRLAAGGVEVSGIKADPAVHTSGTAVMVASDGERSFVHYVGANATLKPEDIDWSVIEAADLLHVAGHFLMPGFDGEPVAEVLERAQSLGKLTTLDTAGAPNEDWPRLLEPVLRHTDVALPSYSEAASVTGRTELADVADWFLERGVKIVALKRGEAGSYVKTADGQEFSVPSFIIEPVDATGAGDAFVAGFLCGLALDWPLEKTARFANATGALCTTAIGAAAGARPLEAVLEFMENTPTR